MILECLSIASILQVAPVLLAGPGCLTSPAFPSCSEQQPKPAVPQAPARTDAAAGTMMVAPMDGSGLLVIRSTLLDGESFTFVTCEALIQDKKTSSLFPMTLAAKDWKHAGERWSYTWEFDDKLRLDFSAQPDGESVLLKYTLTNGSSETLKNVALFPCLPSLGAPSFYPGTAEEAKGGVGGRKARVGRHDYSELYGRLTLFADDKPFSFKDSKLAAEEMHLAYMKKGEVPLVWSWFVNAEPTFDVPLIVESSRDKQYALGLAFDRGIQASSNAGDGRACIHIVPRFAEIPAGKSVSTVGRIYWMRAAPESVLARYLKDSAKPAHD